MHGPLLLLWRDLCHERICLNYASHWTPGRLYHSRLIPGKRALVGTSVLAIGSAVHFIPYSRGYSPGAMRAHLKAVFHPRRSSSSDSGDPVPPSCMSCFVAINDLGSPARTPACTRFISFLANSGYVIGRSRSRLGGRWITCSILGLRLRRTNSHCLRLAHLLPTKHCWSLL